MSHHLVNLAMDLELPAVRKIVLITLAHRAVLSTGKLGIETRELARLCGLSQSCVRDQIKALADSGLLRVCTDAVVRCPVYVVVLKAP